MLLKRQLLILSLLMLGAGLCAVATVQSFAHTREGGEILPAVEEKYTSLDTAAYIVKEENGYVAVFSSKPSRLLQITDISVHNLPAGDRSLLRSGIAAGDVRELLMLLEDLNS